MSGQVGGTVPRAVLAAEWTKIRTVRSTLWTLLVAFAVSVGIGLLVGMSTRNGYDRMTAESREAFDPVLAGFYGLLLGQLSLVVFGVLQVGSEYSTGTIRASLAAIPRRGSFYAGKVLTGTLLALGFSLVTVPVTFLAAQWALGPHGTTMGADEVPRALFGACAYMTLMCAFAMGVATMLRSTAISLGIMIPLLFLGSQGLGNVPGLWKVTQYLPDQAGAVAMQVGDKALLGPRDFGPWAGLAVLVAWTAAAVYGGHLLLRRRDA